jgi:hypothetical protein
MNWQAVKEPLPSHNRDRDSSSSWGQQNEPRIRPYEANLIRLARLEGNRHEEALGAVSNYNLRGHNL